MSGAAFAKKAKAVKLLVFDVDGVLTDGGLYYGPEGEAFKRFHVKDGHGIVMARLTGLPSAILTARSSRIVAVRAEELKLAAVLQGEKYKGPGLLKLCAQVGLGPEQVAYMGDDTNDLPPMALAGLTACPKDAAPDVKDTVDYVARENGGFGAARDFIEKVLKAQGRWKAALAAMSPP